MREILLTNHCHPALVDDDVFELVSHLRWRLRGNPGERCGHVVTTAGAALEYLHHHVLRPPPGMVIDHINGDPLDNRRQNLRVASWRENAWNRAPQRGRSSPYGGVSKIGNVFYASIKHDGMRFHLGVFANEEDAAMAVDRAAITLRGEFARLNIPGVAEYPPVFPSQRLGWTRTRSGFYGVSWDPATGLWLAAIAIGGVPVALGLFETDVEAAMAYDAAAAAVPGLRRLNFPARAA